MRHFNGRRAGVFLAACVNLLAAGGALSFAQSAPSLAMPELSSPAMPSISAPTLGGSFYVPGRRSQGAQSGTAASSESGTSAPSGDAGEKVGTKAQADKASASGAGGALLGGFQRLSAADIAALGNDGAFGSLFGLAGGAASIQNLYGLSYTDRMLDSILKELEELKAERSRSESYSVNQGAADKAVQVKDPAVLRFTVNGCDILATCNKIYFSSRENDGTFLLTGDRKYISDGKTRDETFYMLFRADGSRGAMVGYDVQPAVVQDYLNKYSFLYQLSQRSNLRASKIGNLVSMRVNSAGWNMDLLLDTGSAAKDE